jgi:hypothetical protein
LHSRAMPVAGVTKTAARTRAAVKQIMAAD